METPDNLREAIIHFDSFEHCKAFMVELRWPDGVVKCPRCESEKVFWIEKERVWKCYSKHPSGEVLAEDRDDLRGLAAASTEVASGNVAD